MYRFFFTTILCFLLAGCNNAKKSCDSTNILSALHEKLVVGMNYQIGVDDYYDGKKGKLTLESPISIGKSGDFMRCSISMVLTHYINPKTNVRYSTPVVRTLRMPYSFKNVDANITQIQVGK